MYSPTTRVLAVLELLQAHDALSGAELARRLEVDVRSVRRYIVKLQDLGIPVEAGRGRHGAYRLRPGRRMPPLMLADDEAVALSLGLLAAGRLGLGTGGEVGADDAARRAQAKLERVLPEALRAPLRAVGEAVQLDLARPAGAVAGDVLLALSDAAQRRRRVQLTYADSAGRASERAFDTYGLAWRSGRWYAVGHCHLRGGLRSFRLDRVTSALARAERFTPPADFDAVRHLALGLATLPRAHPVRVRLHCPLAAARAELFDAIGLLQPEGREATLLHGQADDLGWFARQLGRLSCDFEVLEPPALRTALRGEAARLRRLAAAPPR